MDPSARMRERGYIHPTQGASNRNPHTRSRPVPPAGRMVRAAANVIRFQPSGSPTLALSHLEAILAGEGPPEMRKSVFEAFVQTEQGLTRRRDGTGLGLTISRGLARCHTESEKEWPHTESAE